MQLAAAVALVLLWSAPAAAALEKWQELYNQGVTALERGEPRSAADCFERAGRLAPKQPQVMLGLLSAELAGGNAGRAAQTAGRLLGSSNADFEVLLSAGNALLAHGGAAQAGAFFERARAKAPAVIQGEPSSVYFEKRLAAIALQSRQDREAIAHFERLLAAQPGNPENYYGLGLLLIKAADFQKSFALMQKAAAKFPNSAEVCLAHALASYFAGRNDLAEGSYQRLIRMRPEADQPYFALGNFYEDLGRDEEAVEAFRKAVERAPGNALNAYMYGVALYRSRRAAEAGRALEGAIQRNPSHADSHYWLGRVRLNQEQPARALAEFEKAVQLEPKHLGAYYQLGLLYARSGEKEKSGEAFRHQRQLTEQMHQGVFALRMP